MPDPIPIDHVPITIQNKVYNTPILNREMEGIYNQINDKKNEIRSLNESLSQSIIDLQALNKQLIALYIQQTGSFPDS